MSSVKDLKKEVRRVCNQIASEAMTAAAVLGGKAGKEMAAVVTDVANLQTNALAAASFRFDKLPTDFPTKKDYNRARSEFFANAYRSYREKFLGHVEEIVAKMNAALPKAKDQADAVAK